MKESVWSFNRGLCTTIEGCSQPPNFSLILSKYMQYYHQVLVSFYYLKILFAGVFFSIRTHFILEALRPQVSCIQEL